MRLPFDPFRRPADAAAAYKYSACRDIQAGFDQMGEVP